jgi:hypothetical protein
MKVCICTLSKDAELHHLCTQSMDYRLIRWDLIVSWYIHGSSDVLLSHSNATSNSTQQSVSIALLPSNP